MTWAIKASLLAVAASVAAAGALRDQLAGHCRWSHALSSVQQRAKSGGGAGGGGVNSVAAATSARGGVAAAASRRMSSWTWVDKWRRGGTGAAERAKRTEESLSKVMYWDCWGPK